MEKCSALAPEPFIYDLRCCGFEVSYYNSGMGNKELRPSEDDPMRGFDDQQLTYLAEKFELVSNEGGFVDASKLA